MQRRTKLKIKKWIVTILMLFGSIIMIMPFVWMISSSFKMEQDIFNFPIEWIPKEFTLRNYSYVLFGRDDLAYGRQMVPFTVYYWNSIKIAFFGVMGAVIISMVSAYAFARIKFAGRNILFSLYLSTMMFPNAVLLIPRFIVYRYLGLYNTHLALILPDMLSVFGIFMLRQFYMTLPEELFEAARIDGCGHLRMFWQIATPLVKPAVSAFTVLSFVWKWNDFENPLIFLNTPELFTLPVGIITFQDDFQAAFGPTITAALVSMLPLFVVFLFGQKYFVRGIALTGMKS